jgi:hypothetical protein
MKIVVDTLIFECKIIQGILILYNIQIGDVGA